MTDRVVEAVVSWSTRSAGGMNCSNRRAPTTAAAGLATLSVLEEGPVFEYTESLTATAREGLADMRAEALV